MTPLERRYRRLLQLYPAQYRQDRGDEIVGTLLDASGDRSWPTLRESTGLVAGAVRTHACFARERPAAETWRSGVRLAALFLLLQATVDAGTSAGTDLLQSESSALTVAYCVATALCFAALLTTAARHYLLGVGLTGTAWLFEQVVVYGRLGGGQWMPGEAHFWPITLALLAGLPLIWLRSPGGRAWPWALAVVPAAFALPSDFEASLGLRFVVLTTMAACLAAAVVDPRVGIGVAGWPLGLACNFAYAVVAWNAPAYVWIVVAVLLTVVAALLLADPVRRLSRRTRPERTT